MSENNQKSLLKFLMAQPQQQNNFAIPYIEFDQEKKTFQFNAFLIEKNQSLLCYYSTSLNLPDQKIYFTGGVNQSFQAVSFTYILSKQKEKNTISIDQKTNLLQARYNHALVLIQTINRLFVIGGQDQDNWLNTVEYNDHDQWKKAPSMKHKRCNFQTFVQDQYLWVFGGFKGEQDLARSFERIDAYNLTEWEIVEIKGSEAFEHMAGCSVYNGDEILILGGSDGQNISQSVFKLDIQKREIVKESRFLKKPYANGLLVEMENQVLLVGGTQGDFCVQEITNKMREFSKYTIEIIEQYLFLNRYKPLVETIQQGVCITKINNF